MTFVAGRRARAVNYGSFTAITAVPVADGGITAAGVEFAGDLTEQEACDVWWFLTSRDDADETARRALAARRDDPDTCAGCVEVIGYLLGEA